MIYKYSGQTEEEFIADILAIDEAVFDPAILGSDGSLRARYNANRESYILAYDKSKIAGYIIFFPITDDLSERMINENKPFDDDIEGKDVMFYIKGIDFNMFLISIAVLPEYRGKGIGRELMKKCFEFIAAKKQGGCQIKNVFAYAYTDAGARALSKAGFTEEKSIPQPDLETDVKFMRCFFDDLISHQRLKGK